MNLKYIFSTSSEYHLLTYPVLQPGLIRNGIEQPIFAFNKEDTLFEWINIDCILANVGLAEWWFLSHDTVILGQTFDAKVREKLASTPHRIVKLTPSLSNSMGAIHRDVFIEHRGWFESQLATLRAIPDITERKKWCIENENSFLNLEVADCFQHTAEEHHGMQPVYPDTPARLVEYFVGLDLYKIKKNFTGTHNVSTVI